MKSPRLTLTLAASLAASLAQASIAPYAADANTLHLYHFNEAAGGSVTVNSGSVAGNAYTVNCAVASVTPGTVTTMLGASGPSGFGNAINVASVGTSGNLVGFDANGSGAYQGDVNATTPSADRINLSALGMTGTAPFTVEALINLNSSTGNRHILSTDWSGATTGTRGFQFRVTTGGTTGQRLEFNMIHVTGGQRFAEIPVSGTHAYALNQWFHVAITFDGTNTQFYWTKVDPTITTANALGTPTALGATTGTIQGPLVVGNEGRAASNAETFTGLIDEVRISNIARTASQFVFGPNLAPTVFWNVDGNGDWDSPASNWTTSTVPNLSQAIANFGGVGGVATYSVSPTITLTGARTVGTLVFDEALAHSFTLTGAGSLTLSNGAGAAAINDNNGSHAINVPVSLPAQGAAVTVTGAADTLTLGSSVSGSGVLSKGGAGKLLLKGSSAPASYAVSAGTLEVGTGGSLGSGAVSLTGGTLSFTNAGIISPANTISGTSGVVAQNGSGILTLGSNVNFGGTVGLAVNSGTVDLNGTGVSLASLSGANVGASLSDGSGGAGTTTVTVGGTATTDVYASIDNGIDKTLALVKNSSSYLKLRASSTYSGGTTFNQGFFDLYANNALGFGPVAMTAGAGLFTRIALADGVTLSNPVTMDVANPNGGNNGSIMTIGTATATVSGAVTINNYPLAGGHFDGSDTAAGSLILAGPITSSVANGVILRSGFFTLSGGGSYPRLDVRADTSKLGASNGIATNAVVDLAGNGAATLDLNGFNQILAGLTFGTTATTAATTNAATVTNSSGTASTLTLTPAAPVLFGGSITGNLGLNVTASTVTLTKTGANALNGLFTHTGATTVNAGSLILAAGITLPSTGSFTLQNGGTLDATASGLTLGGAQSLQGTGNVIVPTLLVNGTEAPGGSGAAGRHNLTGGRNLGSTSVTNF